MAYRRAKLRAANAPNGDNPNRGKSHPKALARRTRTHQRKAPVKVTFAPIHSATVPNGTDPRCACYGGGFAIRGALGRFVTVWHPAALAAAA